MVRNLFIGLRLFAAGCRNVEDFEYFIVELVDDVEPVQWWNRAAYVGYVHNGFIVATARVN